MVDVSAALLTGRDEGALVELPDGHRLLPEVAEAFQRLQAAAAEAGFRLAIASSYRSFDRQLAIFNGKASGERPVHDDRGLAVDVSALDPREHVRAILRFSALPGASRHHWGTDLDVYDAAAVSAHYRVQLTPEEVAPDGVFGPLHSWLDERMAAGCSEGFHRPYAEDRGGVAPERWHLSHAPTAQPLERAMSAEVLRGCWRDSRETLCLRELLEADLDELWRRYVALPQDWVG